MKKVLILTMASVMVALCCCPICSFADGIQEMMKYVDSDVVDLSLFPQSQDITWHNRASYYASTLLDPRIPDFGGFQIFTLLFDGTIYVFPALDVNVEHILTMVGEETLQIVIEIGANRYILDFGRFEDAEIYSCFIGQNAMKILREITESDEEVHYYIGNRGYVFSADAIAVIADFCDRIDASGMMNDDWMTVLSDLDCGTIVYERK